MSFKSSTVNASKVAASLSSFPSFIEPSRIGITTLAQAQSSRFYADSGKVVEWAREVVSATQIHSKIASLTSTTVAYCDFDGVRADYAVTDTYGRNAVWSDYEFVFHLESTTNSTGDTDLTNGGSTPFGAAKIGNGAQFNTSSNRRLNATVSYNLNWSNDFTWQMWAEINAFVGDKYLVDHMSTSGNKRFIFYSQQTGGNGVRAFFNGNELKAASLSTGVKYKLTAVKDGSTMRLYRDAASQGTTTLGGLTYSGLNTLDIGAAQGTTAANGNATIDEVRGRIGVISADWETTEYNNQNDESTFWGSWADVVAGQNSAFLMFM